MYTKEVEEYELEIYQRVASLAPELVPEIIHVSGPDLDGMFLLTTVAYPNTLKELLDDEHVEQLFERWHVLISQLHELGIYHGDICEENIVFNEGGNGYLIDFGESGYFEELTPATTKQILDYYPFDPSKTPAEQIKDMEHKEIDRGLWLLD